MKPRSAQSFPCPFSVWISLCCLSFHLLCATSEVGPGGWNGDHSLFDVRNRVKFSLEDLPLSFFRELCASRNEFMSLRETQVDVKLAEGKQSKRQKLASKTTW